MLPHEVPSVSLPHERLSVEDELAQLPEEHANAVIVRVWDPDSSHVVSYPLHAPHDPVSVDPQLTPSVLREQDRVSVLLLDPHDPPPHVRTVTLRLSVPDWSQVESKPPQPDHEPALVDPQLTPSVPRLHARVSVTELAPQVPLPHDRVVTVRVCVPV